MQTKHYHTIITIATAVALSFSAHAADGHREVHLNDCPQPVQAAIQAHSRGGHLDDIDLITIEDKSLYVAEVDLAPEVELYIYLNAAGELIKTREDVPKKEIPAFARQLAKTHNGTLDDVEKVTEKGVITWLVEVDRKGKPDLKITLDAKGQVLNLVQERD